MPSIKVITNSNGSGDWVRIINKDGELLLDAHSISPFDLAMLLQDLGHQTDLIECTDEQMEEA